MEGKSHLLTGQLLSSELYVINDLSSSDAVARTACPIIDTAANSSEGFKDYEKSSTIDPTSCLKYFGMLSMAAD